MPYRRTSFFIALAATVAFQASAADVAHVRIINAAGEQAVEVDLDSLKVGQSRQLASSTGAPALVTRTEQGLTIEIAGKTTEVKLGHAEHASWTSDLGDDSDGKRVKVIRFHGDEKVHESGDGQHKVVMIRRAGDAEGHNLSDEEVAEMVEEIEVKLGADGPAHTGHLDAEELAALTAEIETELGGADGEKVIVTRKITRDEEKH